MRAAIRLVLALAAAGVLAVSMRSADAHNWVPRYDGNKWGQSCLVPSPRTTPPTCCQHARAFCTAACGLADIHDGWKNACRANCETAGNVCLQRVQKRPPVGNVPGTKPPASMN